MSLKSLLVIAVLGCGASSAVFAAPAKCEKTVPGWEIEQSSYNLGNVNITVAKEGLKWHNGKLGITLAMHAPDWKLNAYNESNKKYLVLTKSEALEMFQHQRRRDKAEIDAPIRIDKRIVIAGMPTICYLYAHNTDGVSEKFAIDVTKELERGSKLNATQKKYIENAMKHERREYWMSKDITVSSKVSDLFMEKVATTAYADSLPLRLVQIGRDGARTTMFDTKVVKKVTVKPELFKLPAGYTKAENKIALLVNDNDLGGLTEDAEPSSMSKAQSRKHEDVHR